MSYERAPDDFAATMQGERCDTCRRTEARCAYDYKCCMACTHFRAYDNHGHDLNKGNGRRPRPAEHGTERGYQQHRRDNSPTCFACRLAHNQHRYSRSEIA